LSQGTSYYLQGIIIFLIFLLSS